MTVMYTCCRAKAFLPPNPPPSFSCMRVHHHRSLRKYLLMRTHIVLMIPRTRWEAKHGEKSLFVLPHPLHTSHLAPISSPISSQANLGLPPSISPHTHTKIVSMAVFMLTPNFYRSIFHTVTLMFNTEPYSSVWDRLRLETHFHFMGILDLWVTFPDPPTTNWKWTSEASPPPSFSSSHLVPTNPMTWLLKP